MTKLLRMDSTVHILDRPDNKAQQYLLAHWAANADQTARRIAMLYQQRLANAISDQFIAEERPVDNPVSRQMIEPQDQDVRLASAARRADETARMVAARNMSMLAAAIADQPMMDAKGTLPGSALAQGRPRHRM